MFTKRPAYVRYLTYVKRTSMDMRVYHALNILKHEHTLNMRYSIHAFTIHNVSFTHVAHFPVYASSSCVC